MKIKRRILAALLALVLCMSLTVTTFADTDIVSAGIYITVSGNLEQSSPSFMATTTAIKDNPDDAYLLTVVEYKNGNTYIASNRRQSEDGALSLSYNSPIYIDVLYKPTVAYCSHNVQGGSKSPTGYAAYTMEYLNLG